MLLAPKALNDLIGSLDSFPRASLKRGRAYFAAGAVLELECIEADREYVTVVQGGETYEVFLVYKYNSWNSACSCPMQFDCKYCVAALLELQARANGNRKEPPATAKSPKAARPPGSPLYARLVESVGRPGAAEAAFVKRIQSFYDNAKFRDLSENDLASIAGRPGGYNWNQVKLWGASFPSSDYHFWLHLAWEFRKRKWPIPAFMESITQLDLIEPAMKEWERAEQIERWKSRFREFAASAPSLETAPLELRLLVLPNEARLQWRIGSDAPFADIKQHHAKHFGEQFERGELKSRRSLCHYGAPPSNPGITRVGGLSNIKMEHLGLH